MRKWSVCFLLTKVTDTAHSIIDDAKRMYYNLQTQNYTGVKIMGTPPFLNFRDTCNFKSSLGRWDTYTICKVIGSRIIHISELSHMYVPQVISEVFLQSCTDLYQWHIVCL